MRKIWLFVIALATFMVSTFCFADALPGLDNVIAWLGAPPAVVGTIVGVLLEFLLRFFPSKSPLSLLYLVSAVLKKVGSLLDAAGGFLDKVLPQKLSG